MGSSYMWTHRAIMEVGFVADTTWPALTDSLNLPLLVYTTRGTSFTAALTLP